ncbi:hypothetical protein XENTR_v10021287 [Xenopus tropicalis]|nr:hypothetical protein XENTR_v10021287 [Xenopus tropicalis]
MRSCMMECINKPLYRHASKISLMLNKFLGVTCLKSLHCPVLGRFVGIIQGDKKNLSFAEVTCCPVVGRSLGSQCNFKGAAMPKDESV